RCTAPGREGKYRPGNRVPVAHQLPHCALPCWLDSEEVLDAQSRACGSIWRVVRVAPGGVCGHRLNRHCFSAHESVAVAAAVAHAPKAWPRLPEGVAQRDVAQADAGF